MSGHIVYEGPSALDGAPIVVILTAINGSMNRKTGHMVQSYILRADIDPVKAAQAGHDASICGQCEHRPALAKKTGRAPCYVNIGQGPLQVFKAYRRGSYHRTDPATAAALITARKLRIGSYGDPAAAPLELWQTLTRHTRGHTGYTHQWQRRDFDHSQWRALVMASADTIDQAALANLYGLRAFRVSVGPNKQPGEAICPASAEAGRRTTCAECMLCNGSTDARDIVIEDHARGHQSRVIKLERAASC
jgi:hypothetical protein